MYFWSEESHMGNFGIRFYCGVCVWFLFLWFLFFWVFFKGKLCAEFEVFMELL